MRNIKANFLPRYLFCMARLLYSALLTAIYTRQTYHYNNNFRPLLVLFNLKRFHNINEMEMAWKYYLSSVKVSFLINNIFWKRAFQWSNIDWYIRGPQNVNNFPFFICVFSITHSWHLTFNCHRWCHLKMLV